jgi:hypothetical protein
MFEKTASIILVFALLTGVSSLSHAANTGPADDPAVAFWTTEGVKIATLEGQELLSLRDYQYQSLDGNVHAGSRLLSGGGSPSVITARDATTGDRLFKIRNARSPVVLADGRKVGFLPDRGGKRDPFVASVWIRNAQGKERRIVQFVGPRRTVTPRGFRMQGGSLDVAFDARGRKLAVSYGFDGGDGSVDLLEYDVWVVDVRTRVAIRMTHGRNSRWQSLSPSGERLAVAREVDLCGGGYPGYRASDIRVMSTTTYEKVTLLTGTCDLYYTDPRWISEDELVAARLTRQAPEQYAVDLVRVDATTGEVTEIVAGGDVIYLSASASLQQVAYARRDVDGFTIHDLATGEVVEFHEGFIPQLAGEHRAVQ